MKAKHDEEKEGFKDNILLPYTLEVIKSLRKLEKHIREEYIKIKNSMDLKSLDRQKNIEIRLELGEKYCQELLTHVKGPMIEESNRFMYKKGVSKKRKIEKLISEKMGIKIFLLILARIFHYDGKLLWEEINKNINKKERVIISQPFYEVNYYHEEDPNTIGLDVKDYIAIPRDFVAAYFGYDTGIDGLNLLFKGGFLLPPDRSVYISISGEAGIGKSVLAIKLITAFFQNYGFKNVYCQDKDREGNCVKLNNTNAELLSIHYILVEQNQNNIIRLVKECDLIDPENKNVVSVLGEINKGESLTENEIKKIINFSETDMFSPLSLIEEVQKIENDKKNENKRKVIVIDPVNAIQEIDISRTEWRELFQGIKEITRMRNTIVFFILEKNPDQPDFFVEYLSDIVIKLHKVFKHDSYFRIFELVKSRFQKLFHGKNIFYITKPDSGFIRVYPSIKAMAELIPNRKRVQPTNFDFNENKKEVGIKIDGIINFFKYTHLYENKMAPFFHKNTICMFSGDRGCHKSSFAKKFALSAFRDERCETSTGYIVEFDYREQEANRPWEELMTIGFWNSKPKEKAIALLLYFSENYKEDPENDIIWDTYFGKVIIPGCKSEGKRYIGYISHIVCSYEVKGLTEDVYIYQLDEFIRAIESFNVTNEIPENYIDFIRYSSISLMNRKTRSGQKTKKVSFNPYNTIYSGDFFKNFEIDCKAIKEFMNREIHIMGFGESDTRAEKVTEFIGKMSINVLKQLREIKNLIFFAKPLNISHAIKKIIAVIKTCRSDMRLHGFLLEGKLNDALNNIFRIVLEEIRSIERGEYSKLKKLSETEIKRLKNKLNIIETQIHKIDFLRRMHIFQIIWERYKKKCPSTKYMEEDKLEEIFLDKKKGRSKLPYSDHEGNALFNYKFFCQKEIKKIEKNQENEPFRLNDEEIKYKDTKRVKITRMVLDDAENLENVYNILDPKRYISTMFHLCLAREITLVIVNTRSENETSQVDTVCNAVSDIVFQFEKKYFKGDLFKIVHIIRSSTGFHNKMMYSISKRDDKLLQLNNTFALLSDIEKQNTEPLKIRLFLPDLSKEFAKYMYSLLIERDMYMLDYADDKPGADQRWPQYFSKRFKFSTQATIIDRERLETLYDLREKFPSNYKDWQDFLKDMITYSLAHPNVEIFTANDPFTDISIILEDETAKDAITILCLPGYLMDLYEKNLASISDYIRFPGSKKGLLPGEEDYFPVKVYVDEEKWISFDKDRGTDDNKPSPGEIDNGQNNSKTDETDKKDLKFGHEFYYLKKATIRVPEDSGKKENNENGNKGEKKEAMNRWILPEVIFNPVIARNEKTNKIIKKKYKNEEYIDIKGYPYYIDTRVDLVFSLEDEVKKNQKEVHSFIHDTPHDFVAMFFELWFKLADEDRAKLKCDHEHLSCKEKCNFCFSAQAYSMDTKKCSRENGGKSKDILCKASDKFAKYIKEAAEFDQEGLIRKLKKLADGSDKSIIVLREWYSSAQLKLAALESFLHTHDKRIYVRMEIPDCFLYTTWYLAIPVNSPQRDTASEMITKMTEPQDLAYLQISGIGLQLSDRFYDRDIPKSYPEYEYHKVREAMERLINGKSGKGNLGIPISAIPCYFDLLTPLGGMLKDVYRGYRNSISRPGKRPPGKILTLKEDLSKKLIAFSKSFKYWQEKEKERCKSCYMSYLFCNYNKKGR